MGAFSAEKLYGMTIRESATDGSDFTNPDADYRRLFLGEDGQLHVKDSAGAVTDIGSSSGGAATTDHFVTTQDEADLSAEVARPELDDFSISGATPIDFTAPSFDDASITGAASSGLARIISCTDVATKRHAYVSSAVGTGDFDYRMRVVDFIITTPHTAASNPLFGLFVADSSLTVATRLGFQVSGAQTATAPTPYVFAIVGSSGQGQIAYVAKLFPLIMRIKRVGTTITWYFSTNEGRAWQTMATATSSLNVARVGVWLLGGSVGTQTSALLVHWLRSF